MNDLKFRQYKDEQFYYWGLLESGIFTNPACSMFDRYPPMQYTGFKDCKNKEIYVGDIVKNNWTHDAEDFELLEIRFCDSGYSNTMGFHALNMDGEISNFYGGMPDLEALEVVGNIYENKELLGGTE